MISNFELGNKRAHSFSLSNVTLEIYMYHLPNNPQNKIQVSGISSPRTPIGRRRALFLSNIRYANPQDGQMNHCEDLSTTYYIEVFRVGPTDCPYYQLAIANGPVDLVKPEDENDGAE